MPRAIVAGMKSATPTARIGSALAAIAAAALMIVVWATPAAAFGVSGAIVDLTPAASGGELDLSQQIPFLEAARRPEDPTATLVTLMAQLQTQDNRRAAFAWIVATSQRPAIEGPAALYALVRAGVTDPKLIFQAAAFAQAKGARGYDLYRWAEAAGLPDPARAKLAALSGDGSRYRQDPWRVTRMTAPVAAAAGGG